MPNDSLTPPAHLPLPLMVSDQGSFAQDTVYHRLPRIARQTIDENRFPAALVDRLEALIAEIPHGRLRPIGDDGGPDGADWAAYLRPYQGLSWTQVPWYFAEAYFYRRILEACDYFGCGPTAGVDPYAQQKRSGLEGAGESLVTLSAFANDQANAPDEASQVLFRLLHQALWGNRVDMSLWQAGSRAQEVSASRVEHEQDKILNDHTQEVIQYLAADRGRTIHFVLDNAGFELFCDLLLADYLLNSQLAAVVDLSLKSCPVFVSDALIKDVHLTIARLADNSGHAVRRLAERLQGHLAGGRLRLHDHFFWTSPLFFWQLPPDLLEKIESADLVIFKGDANYRRLLGDAHWPLTTPFERIVSYFPRPLLALRTLKSELGAGLPAGRIAALSAAEPDWLVNGRYGVIQCVLPGQ